MRTRSAVSGGGTRLLLVGLLLGLTLAALELWWLRDEPPTIAAGVETQSVYTPPSTEPSPWAEPQHASVGADRLESRSRKGIDSAGGL